MTWRLRNMTRIGAGLLAVLMVGLLPTAGRAEALLFRNETNGPIIVQAACVVRGVLRRDRPYLLLPGNTTPGIAMPGNKLITIYDGAHPNIVIFQGTIPSGPADQAFGVSVDPTGGVKVDPKAMPLGP